MSMILMPALSPTMEEGKLARWHVRVGDRIEPGQVIAEIETDKATMEVEAVDPGVVEIIFVPEGSEGVAVNTPIAQLAGGDSASAPTPEPALKAPAPPAAASAPAAQKPEPARPAPAPVDPGKATPLAARIAHLAGLALAQVPGSGPHGRILRADVEAALGLQNAAPAAKSLLSSPISAPPAVALSQPRPSLEAMGIAPGSYDLVPLDGMRRTIARRMADAFRDAPHFPLTADLRVDALLEMRERLNGVLEADGLRCSVNDLVIKAAAIALKREPEVNASFTPDGIALHRHADIAMAVAIDGGLVTPIVRAAETKSVGEIARQSKDLAARARAKALAPSEYQGGTFSVSNLGMFGIKSFASILNEPQGAILSVGAVEKRPVIEDNAVVIGQVMSVTLTCDHRAMDGAAAARWLQAFRSIVEQPLQFLL